jgi:hypothetical protein
MRLLVVISICIASIGFGIISPHAASANVWIPDNEFLGYYDSNGTYTVVGAVKNTENMPVIPSITINVKDGDKEISDNYTFSIINSQTDIPFKIKIPEVGDKNATLETPQVSFVTSSHNALDIDVIYGRTLIKHPDGHTSGFILNNDTSPAYGVRVYAVIYGKDGKILDTGKSIETIERMDPGQKIAFSMYPDPQFASNVSYYSCFVVGGDGSQTEWVERNGNKFYFSFITSGAVAYPKYDDLTQTLSLTVRQPFPEKGFVNFMFTQETGDEKFTVKVNGNPIEFLQSKDPQGSWHVSFNVPQRSVSNVEISGFGTVSNISQSPVNNRDILLVVIPIVAVAISIIIWKKKKD